MKKAVVMALGLLALSAFAAPPDFTEMDWLSLTNRPFEEIESTLGGYYMVVGEVGNVWTREQWTSSARTVDLADHFIYKGMMSGQEIHIVCYFYMDTASSRLHPTDRLLDFYLEFDKPPALAEICALSPWVKSFVNGHYWYEEKFSWGFSDCVGSRCMPFQVFPVCWVTEKALVVPSIGKDAIVLKLGFFGIGLGDRICRPLAKCYKPYKNGKMVPKCAD